MNSTSKTPNTDALIERLTVEDAKAYAPQTDKLIWIETTLLDPADIPRKMAIRVEDALLAILFKNGLMAPSLFDGLDITAKWADGHHPFGDIDLMDRLLDRGTHAEMVQWMLWNDPATKVDQTNANAVRDEVESQIAYAKREHAADMKSAEYAHADDRYRGDWEQKMEDGFRIALNVVLSRGQSHEFARKPAVGQGSLDFEESHPRESSSHDGKKPGEFAPKSETNQPRNPVMNRDNFYVRVRVSPTKNICEGPFPSRDAAWLHEYTNSLLVAHKSDHRAGIMVRKDGAHASIMRGDLLAEDIENSDDLGIEFAINPVSELKNPERFYELLTKD